MTDVWELGVALGVAVCVVRAFKRPMSWAFVVTPLCHARGGWVDG